MLYYTTSLKEFFQFWSEKWGVASKVRLFLVVFSKSPLELKPRLKPMKQVLYIELLHKYLWLLNIHLNKREDFSRIYIREQNNE